MYSTDPTSPRHQGNAESHAAYQAAFPKVRAHHARILNGANLPAGITCRDLAVSLNVGLNVVSGRFTELKQAGLIEKAGVRDGCAVFKLAYQFPN